MRRTQFLSLVMPSLADMLFISLLVALAYGTPSLRLLNDPGIGWHIRTGEWILQHHSIPHVDLFSATVKRPWFAWEWLFDVAAAAVHRAWGLNGVLVGGAITIASTFSLLFRMMLHRGATLLLALVCVLLAVLASTIHCLARPHLLSWLFTLLCWYILEHQRESRWLWAIPGLVTVWANVHGAFLIAFVLLAFATVTEYWPRAAGSPAFSSSRVRRRLVAVLIASLLGSLLNPYGINLYRHIFQYLSDSFLMQHIQEMHSPDFHSFAARCFALLVLISGCIAVAKRREFQTGQMLAILFFSFSGLYAVRNIPVACVILCLTVSPFLTFATVTDGRRHMRSRLAGFSGRMTLMEHGSSGHLWAILAVAVTFAACSNHGHLLGRDLIHANFNPERYPERAVSYLQAHPVQDPIFTTDAWGGYVIYRAWPGAHVVVDDRHDMYGSDYMKLYLKIVDGDKDWRALLQSTGARSVLVPSTAALSSLLRLTPEWRLTYDDGQAAVFEATNTETTHANR